MKLSIPTKWRDTAENPNKNAIKVPQEDQNTKPKDISPGAARLARDPW